MPKPVEGGARTPIIAGVVMLVKKIMTFYAVMRNG